MNKKYKVHCLDNGLTYVYMANNTWDALEYHIYYLSISNKLNINNIKKSVTQTDNGMHLIANDLTYWIRKN